MNAEGRGGGRMGALRGNGHAMGILCSGVGSVLIVTSYMIMCGIYEALIYASRCICSL